MRSKNLLFLLAVVLTSGLIAAGCGDDDSTTSTAAETTATESTASEDTDATTEESTTTDSDSGSSDIDSEGVYNACIDVISGTAAEAAGETACAQARDAFEQCAQQAESLPEDNSARDDAIAICQDAADQAVKSLEAAG
jgi:hypothetical protein